MKVQCGCQNGPTRSQRVSARQPNGWGDGAPAGRAPTPQVATALSADRPGSPTRSSDESWLHGDGDVDPMTHAFCHRAQGLEEIEATPHPCQILWCDARHKMDEHGLD